MATFEQIEKVTAEFNCAKPDVLFEGVKETQMGISAVIRFLYEAEDTVTAGKLSSVMHISTARVAVLLRKMEAKGLILKERDASDGRITVVRLTERGLQTAEKMKAELYENIGHIIDTVGEARLWEFISIYHEIRAAAKKPSIHF